jgi:TRAP-type mannitol/chloroaromatic compound transport system substrate-binding protein
MTPTVTKSASPDASVNRSESCAVLDQMQSSLSTAVTDLIADPDLVVAFEKEFDNQLASLDDLTASLQGGSAEQIKLQTDIDAAVLAKDEALQTFKEAQQADNAFAKTLGLAEAALSARDAVSAAEQVFVDLSVQLHCG